MKRQVTYRSHLRGVWHKQLYLWDRRWVEREMKKTAQAFTPAAKSCSLSLGELYTGIAQKQKSQKQSNPLQIYVVVEAIGNIIYNALGGKRQVKESQGLTCKLIIVRFLGICATKYIFSPLVSFFFIPWNVTSDFQTSSKLSVYPRKTDSVLCKNVATLTLFCSKKPWTMQDCYQCKKHF